MHYKAPDQSLYFLSDEDIQNGWEDSLPAGCVRITDDEVNAIQSQSSKLQISIATKSRLAQIDQESIRPARAIAMALAAGQAAPVFELGKLASLETEAAKLRAELVGL